MRVVYVGETYQVPFREGSMLFKIASLMVEDLSDEDICKKLDIDKSRIRTARFRWKKKDPEYFNPKQVVEPVKSVKPVQNDGVKPVDAVVSGENDGKDLDLSSKEGLAQYIVKVMDEQAKKGQETPAEPVATVDDSKVIEIIPSTPTIPTSAPLDDGTLLLILKNLSPEQQLIFLKNRAGLQEAPVATTYAPSQSDASTVKKIIENLPPAELRLLLRKKSETVENPMMTALQYLEMDTPLLDVMSELNLDFEKGLEIQEKFNRMKELELERQQLAEPFLKIWFDMGRVMGENVRRNCKFYNEVTGICRYWKLDDLTQRYRSSFKGVFRSAKKQGAGFFVNVERHAEMCSICAVGVIQLDRGILSEGNP